MAEATNNAQRDSWWRRLSQFFKAGLSSMHSELSSRGWKREPSLETKRAVRVFTHPDHPGESISTHSGVRNEAGHSWTHQPHSEGRMNLSARASRGSGYGHESLSSHLNTFHQSRGGGSSKASGGASFMKSRPSFDADGKILVKAGTDEVKHPGSRGGQGHYNKQGHWRYGIDAAREHLGADHVDHILAQPNAHDEAKKRAMGAWHANDLEAHAAYNAVAEHVRAGQPSRADLERNLHSALEAAERTRDSSPLPSEHMPANYASYISAVRKNLAGEGPKGADGPIEKWTDRDLTDNVAALRDAAQNIEAAEKERGLRRGHPNWDENGLAHHAYTGHVPDGRKHVQATETYAGGGTYDIAIRPFKGPDDKVRYKLQARTRGSTRQWDMYEPGTHPTYDAASRALGETLAKKSGNRASLTIHDEATQGHHDATVAHAEEQQRRHEAGRVKAAEEARKREEARQQHRAGIDESFKGVKFKQDDVDLSMPTGTMKSRGLTLGHLAVHRPVDADGTQQKKGWKITHRPSGLAIDHVDDLNSAKLMTHRLHNLGVDWSFDASLLSKHFPEAGEAVRRLRIDPYADLSDLEEKLKKLPSGKRLEANPPRRRRIMKASLIADSDGRLIWAA